MTVPIRGHDILQKLRELEEAIAVQRKLIAAESSGCDRAAERRHLGKLLTELDQILKECRLTRQRPAQTRSHVASDGLCRLG
jgi:hypothetical protein